MMPFTHPSFCNEGIIVALPSEQGMGQGQSMMPFGFWYHSARQECRMCKWQSATLLSSVGWEGTVVNTEAQHVMMINE